MQEPVAEITAPDAIAELVAQLSAPQAQLMHWAHNNSGHFFRGMETCLCTHMCFAGPGLCRPGSVTLCTPHMNGEQVS